jgi:hypothetical protein
MSPDGIIKKMYEDVDKAINKKQGFSFSDIARVTLPAAETGKLGQKSPADQLKDYLFKSPSPEMQKANEQVETKLNPPKDYDYAGYEAKYGKPDQSKGQHLTDEFKLPNHMTFSSDSKYSTADEKGGEWKKEGGKWNFYASPFNLTQHSADEMKDYFAKHEKDAVLHLPGEKKSKDRYSKRSRRDE